MIKSDISIFSPGDAVRHGTVGQGGAWFYFWIYS